MAAPEKQTNNSAGLVVGVDATNLRRGGGVTHLVALLGAANPEKHGIDRVIVWGGKQTLAKLPNSSWLEKVNPVSLDCRFPRRIWWQKYQLSRAARDAQCDVLFVPGGSYAGSFKPIVTMSRNLLPFEWQELYRYGKSLLMLRLLLLRFIQTRSFRRADGVLFLTEYAKNSVQNVTGALAGDTAIIPHGIAPAFKSKPRTQRAITECTESDPFRLLYVSIIDVYKHQWKVVRAVNAIRQEGFPLALELVGPAYQPALNRLQAAIRECDPEGVWIRYRGSVHHDALQDIYKNADLGIFASSCENMPNILLEKMAAGLPIACSIRGPMPEILGDAGVYFDPENTEEIKEAVRELISRPDLRTKKAEGGFSRAKKFTWKRCADQTFAFLSTVARVQGQ